jgi:hypothetical protein
VHGQTDNMADLSGGNGIWRMIGITGFTRNFFLYSQDVILRGKINE